MKIKIGKKLGQYDDKLIEAYVKMLQKHEWTLFFNVSIRVNKTPEGVKKMLKRFFKELNTKESKFYSKYMHCYVFYEKQHRSSTVHIHALVDRINPMHAKEIERKARKFFGISKVEAYDENKGATYYLARKIGTSNLDDYDYYKINSKIR